MHGMMLGGASVPFWIGFHLLVLVLLAWDLAAQRSGVTASSHRRDLVFTLVVIAIAAAFAGWLGHEQGRQIALEFTSGYLIELSLSVDNLFVFLVLFRAFGLKELEQKRALLFGVLGAIVMRGAFIAAGVALLERFAWVQYIFGALLVVAAMRLVRKHPDTGAGRSVPWIARVAERLTFSGRSGVLFAALVAVEVTDLVFALDSVPAVLAVSHRIFVVYTSNILAILGLRSLYFLLAGMLQRLRFLHYGLAAVLGFVGVKMLVAGWYEIPLPLSLGVIVVVVAVATTASLLLPERAAIQTR